MCNRTFAHTKAVAAAAIAPHAKNLLLHGCLLVGKVAAARGYGNGTRGRAGWATAALEYVEALGQNGFKCVFFFFFLWVRILCLSRWEGEEAQKEQTCPGLASSPRRNIISSTPSCIQGWGWVRNQQWHPAHLPLDGCCARVCLCTCCLTLFSQWTEAGAFNT